MKNVKPSKICKENLNEFEKLYTEAEAAEILTIGRTTLQRHRLDGKIDHYQVGKQIRYTAQQIQEYLTRCQREMSLESNNC